MAGAYHGGGGLYRPNSQANRVATLQPRTNGMQKLEAHFNGGYLRGGSGKGGGAVYDDPLDGLGKHAAKLSSQVANEVRGLYHP